MLEYDDELITEGYIKECYSESTDITSALTYAMWGIRELPSISQENTSTELVDVN